MRDKVEDQKQSEDKDAQLANTPAPSASSSPSHDFSFTISLHPPATTVPSKAAKMTTLPSIAVDLSPADDIFFHGHLLPLHLLSHLPVSSRTSTNSLDSFTLPIKELLEEQNPNDNISDNCYYQSSNISTDQTKRRTKSRSLSTFFGLSKWRKGCEVREKEGKDKQKKKKLRFDVSKIVKKYMRMVRPLLSFPAGRDRIQICRQPYSFSGNLSLQGRKELRGSKGELSAPASMRTSPTNSGLLLATGTIPTSTSDSTMEELQAAIQAAIAHCKNSIAMEEKIIC